MLFIYSDGSPAKSSKIDTRAITSEVDLCSCHFSLDCNKYIILACVQHPRFLSFSYYSISTSATVLFEVAVCVFILPLFGQWDPESINEDTEFIMGVKANK